MFCLNVIFESHIILHHTENDFEDSCLYVQAIEDTKVGWREILQQKGNNHNAVKQ